MAPYDMASALDARTLEKRYFESSLSPLTPEIHDGLIPIAVFSVMSLISVTALLLFITHRLVSWRRHYRQYVGYNQYVILIYNLLIADLQQSIAFSISFHWLKIDKIIAPTAPCFLQAWFLQMGDVSSGAFVLAIAIHTWLGVVKGYRIPYFWFVVSILSIWAVALFLTILGPAIHRDLYFARAGGWCWVADEFQNERLWLHYFWIFVFEFGTMIIYGHIFFHLRGRISSILANESNSKLSRATKFMVLYPAVYVILTLPIAVGRMVTMTGTEMPDIFVCIGGALLTSCGWIDAALYALTRKVLVSQESSTGQYNRAQNGVAAISTSATRPGDDHHFGLQSMGGKEPITSTARSVTIVGGSKRFSRIVDNRRGRTNAPRSRNEPTLHEVSPTRSGSQDSIIKPEANGINIITETNIQVESTYDDAESGTPSAKDWSDTDYHARS